MGRGAATRPIARGYCTRAVDGPGATQRDSRHIHNSHSRASSFPFPQLPFQLLPAGARADTGELKLGLELRLRLVLGLGDVLFARRASVGGTQPCQLPVAGC